MTYEVRLAPQAGRDLRNLYKERQVETSHHAAVCLEGLEAEILSLETRPQSAVATPEDASLRHLLYGKKPHIYRIIYSIDEKLQRVNIAQIRHGARKPLPSDSTGWASGQPQLAIETPFRSFAWYSIRSAQ